MIFFKVTYLFICMDMLDYLKSINDIDKELIVPSSKNFLIGKIGNDEILLKDIFKAFEVI